MITEKIKYTDFDGLEREEDFQFNLTAHELAKLNFSVSGGMEAKIKKIIEKHDSVEVYKTFEEIIALAYGEKSDDGKRFVKSPELSKAFFETNAWEELFMKLFQDANYAADFINRLIPKNIPNIDDKLKVLSDK